MYPLVRAYDADREEKQRNSKIAGAARDAPFAAGLCNLEARPTFPAATAPGLHVSSQFAGH